MSEPLFTPFGILGLLAYGSSLAWAAFTGSMNPYIGVMIGGQLAIDPLTGSDFVSYNPRTDWYAPLSAFLISIFALWLVEKFRKM